MKTSRKLFISLGFAMILAGCKPSWDVTLYSQKIKGSNKIIYKYDAWGGRDSHKFGFAILDSVDEFDMSEISYLPGSYFAETPTKDYIKLINIRNLEKPTTPKNTILTPSKKHSKNIMGFKVDIIEYNETYGSSPITSLMEYEFDIVKEKDDSLTFENVTRKFGIELPSKVSFPKGNIVIDEDSTGTVHRISIEKFIKAKGEIYKPTKPLEIVPGQAIIGFATFYFLPKRMLKSSSLTNYGIFKKVKENRHE